MRGTTAVENGETPAVGSTVRYEQTVWVGADPCSPHGPHINAHCAEVGFGEVMHVQDGVALIQVCAGAPIQVPLEAVQVPSC